MNAIFGPNEKIFSVNTIIFIKKKKKKKNQFLKTYGRNMQIFEFLRENFPKLAKILRLSSKFQRITLKNVKMLLKN